MQKHAPQSLALAGCLWLLCQLSAGAHQPSEIRIFNDGPKLLIVHGYSTSQHWWAFLQRKIDRHAGGADDRTIEVRLCNKGGTPISRWMDLETGARSEAWERMLTPMIKGEQGKRPVIVLAQQSLQGVYPGGFSTGIGSAEDRDRIMLGADAIERYSKLILEDGAAAVIVGMHIFKHSMEPAIGNERLALAELINRKPAGIFPGPDTWQPTKEHFPLAFDRDRLHPNFIGAEIMAHYWFDALLKREGLQTPAWSAEEMKEAIETKPMGTVRDRDLFSQKLKQWKIASRPPLQSAAERSGPGSRRPPGSGNGIPSRILERYDKDKDGKLNQEERDAFQKARAARQF